MSILINNLCSNELFAGICTKLVCENLVIVNDDELEKGIERYLLSEEGQPAFLMLVDDKTSLNKAIENADLIVEVLSKTMQINRYSLDISTAIIINKENESDIMNVLNCEATKKSERNFPFKKVYHIDLRPDSVIQLKNSPLQLFMSAVLDIEEKRRIEEFNSDPYECLNINFSLCKINTMVSKDDPDLKEIIFRRLGYKIGSLNGHDEYNSIIIKMVQAISMYLRQNIKRIEFNNEILGYIPQNLITRILTGYSQINDLYDMLDIWILENINSIIKTSTEDTNGRTELFDKCADFMKDEFELEKSDITNDSINYKSIIFIQAVLTAINKVVEELSLRISKIQLVERMSLLDSKARTYKKKHIELTSNVHRYVNYNLNDNMLRARKELARKLKTSLCSYVGFDAVDVIKGIQIQPSKFNANVNDGIKEDFFNEYMKTTTNQINLPCNIFKELQCKRKENIVVNRKNSFIKYGRHFFNTGTESVKIIYAVSVHGKGTEFLDATYDEKEYKFDMQSADISNQGEILIVQMTVTYADKKNMSRYTILPSNEYVL